MTGQSQAITNLLPVALPSIDQEARKRKQLAGVRLGRRCADRTAGAWTDRDKVILAVAYSATVQVQPEAQLGQQQHFVTHERACPAKRGRRCFNGRQEAVERRMDAGIRMPFREGHGGQRSDPINRRRRQRLSQKRSAAVAELDICMGKLILRSRAEASLDNIAGHEDGPHSASTGSANIGCLQAVLRSHQPHDRAMLGMVAERADDGGRVEIHAQPDGWK